MTYSEAFPLWVAEVYRNEDDYSDEFYTEADVVRHEIALARN